MQFNNVIDLLRERGATDFDLWQYLQNRADNEMQKLWTTGTWLLTLMAAILAVPFTADFIQVVEGESLLKINKTLPVIMLTAFGLFLSFLTWSVLKEYANNIQWLWKTSNYILNPNEPTYKFRSVGYIVLRLGIIGFSGCWFCIIFILIFRA